MASAAAVNNATGICGKCGHALKKHCKGKDWHGDWRGPGSGNCVSRHCMEPLCSCVEYVEVTE